MFRRSRSRQDRQEAKNSKKLKKFLAHIQRLQANKISVTQERHEQLKALLDGSDGKGGEGHSLLLVLDCSSSGGNSLGAELAMAVPQLSVQTETVIDGDMNHVKRLLKPKEEAERQRAPDGQGAPDGQRVPDGLRAPDGQRAPNAQRAPDGQRAPDAVVLLCGSKLTVFQKLVVATTFLKGKPALVLAEGASAEECAEARQWTAETWPVFEGRQQLVEYVRSSLPNRLRLRTRIHDDIHERLDTHKRVNLTKFAVSRGAVALIPFAVSAMNFASLLKLCRQCMLDTGMGTDKQTRRATAAEGGKTGAVELAYNTMGDAYQYLAQGAILADMVAAGTLEAALATLDVLDVFLLGSISVVTGAISAFTAYKTRPGMVNSIADVMVMLQFVYMVNPQMRRV